jgi:hypothetical protein
MKSKRMQSDEIRKQMNKKFNKEIEILKKSQIKILEILNKSNKK